eukprot:COSAG06_NODE_31414_length_522_cov_0.586288_1_plen_56_part_10
MRETWRIGVTCVHHEPITQIGVTVSSVSRLQLYTIVASLYTRAVRYKIATTVAIRI